MRVLEAAVLFVALISAAAAQAPDRNALIQKIQESVGRPPPITADSTVVATVLQPARVANPGADASTWLAVQADTASAMTQMTSGHDSISDRRIRVALGSFSDAELQALSQKLDDPVVLKFRDALRSEARPDQNVMTDVLRLNAQINAILTQHHLKPVEGSAPTMN
jgi:hypothetical protein